MATRKRLRASDVATVFISVSLALSCAGFAAGMIFRLQGMKDPPADMGLNFPGAAKKKKIIAPSPRAEAADPLITGATDSVEGGGNPPLLPYRNESPVLGYRLLAVADGVAFVEVKTVTRTEIKAISKGADLPGAGPVDDLLRTPSGWTLKAGSVTLRQASQ
ncbi:hypothetical protein [Aestuariivirga sp.]|uniref:hypothetical protein n=1 Tax=Aestuariivirga sp. TaxID=2650926 RepID=UPI0039E31350